MIQNQEATALCPAPSPSSRAVQERQIHHPRKTKNELISSEDFTQSLRRMFP